ncbi:MAG: efflux RND transporter periplasmic adaptor subunit [Planctomycetota bacterium]|nr:MAG: efflux RND transporter periplasmic adaptor subunit [Planctomycetota bacterium]
MTKEKTTVPLIGLVVGIALVSAAAWLLTGCKQTAPPEKAVTRPVKTMVLGIVKAPVRYSYPGEVRPSDSVELAFQVAGPLIELPVKRGEEVEQGQLLARIDPRDFKNKLDAAQAVLDEAKATLTRYEQAAKSGAISKQQVAEQRAKVEVAQANLNIQQKAHEDTFLKAPYAGRIAERYVENFQNVQAKEKILSLQNIEQIEVVFYVPEKDLLTANRDNKGRFVVTSESLPGRKFEASLREFDTDADPVTQTYMVRLIMPAPEDVNILPGMTVQVTWIAPKADKQDSIFRIPANAVFSQKPGEQVVWLIDQSAMTVSQQPVALDELSGNEVAVTSGLKLGDMIAISGVHHLREGMKIRSMQPDTQEASK